jgi:hypothetical protein
VRGKSCARVAMAHGWGGEGVVVPLRAALKPRITLTVKFVDRKTGATVRRVEDQDHLSKARTEKKKTVLIVPYPYFFW